MSLAGAIILILSMANALMNYVVDQHVPTKVLDFMTGVGIQHMWQFLLVMNVFLLVLGMLMEGFSAILVAVPLILPFVAKIGNANPGEKMSPFQLAMIFLLNLEIAYCMPPLGLNLFISSFRFNRPGREPVPRRHALRRASWRVGLVVVSYVPWFSNVAVASDVAAVRAKAEKDGIAAARRVDDRVRAGGPEQPAAVLARGHGEVPGRAAALDARRRAARRTSPRTTRTSCPTRAATRTSTTARTRARRSEMARREPQIGDVFAVRGRQARSGASCRPTPSSGPTHGCLLVYVYRDATLSREALLVPPMLTTRAPFYRGLFEHRGSRPLMPRDYFERHVFRDAKGQPLRRGRAPARAGARRASPSASTACSTSTRSPTRSPPSPAATTSRRCASPRSSLCARRPGSSSTAGRRSSAGRRRGPSGRRSTTWRRTTTEPRIYCSEASTPDGATSPHGGEGASVPGRSSSNGSHRLRGRHRWTARRTATWMKSAIARLPLSDGASCGCATKTYSPTSTQSWGESSTTWRPERLTFPPPHSWGGGPGGWG